MSAVFSSLFQANTASIGQWSYASGVFRSPYLPKSSSLGSVAPATHGAAPPITASR
jgi:hypothetical protein